MDAAHTPLMLLDTAFSADYVSNHSHRGCVEKLPAPKRSLH
jgi:hypothetical protein